MVLTFYILLSGFFPGVFASEDLLEGRFRILPESKVFLAGTTNINKFKCDCGNTFDIQKFHLNLNPQDRMDFTSTSLQLPVEYFDCKNSKMDRDLQKALKAEQYPYIGIELKQFSMYPGEIPLSGSGEGLPSTAKVNITIAGVTRTYEIQVRTTKDAHLQFRFAGNKTMNMTDFNISPPVALFGMIKVNDPITFHFNLLVQVENPPGATLPQ